MSTPSQWTWRRWIERMQPYAGDLHPEEKVAQIAQHHRIQNSPGMDDAVLEMAAVLREAGIATQIEEFQSDDRTFYQGYITPGGWMAEGGQLRLHGTGEVLADFAVGPIQLIQRSCSTAGTELLEVYVADDLEEIMRVKPDLTGKILLTKRDIHMVKDLVHDRFGARGILFDGIRPTIGRDEGERNHARQYTSFWWHLDDEPTFGFVLSPHLGLRLREMVQAGQQVLVECEVKTRFFRNSLKVLHAEIPGKRDEAVLLVAHICHPYPGVNDNASGAGAGVETMLFLQRLLREQILDIPERGIELILVPEYSGTFAFLDRHLTTKRYSAGINLDMVGEDQETCGSSLIVEAPPQITPGAVRDVLFEILQDVTAEHHFRLQRSPFNGGSDHTILSDPLVGIPCPMIIQWPDRFYHSDLDTYDKLDPIILRDVTLATAIYLYHLAAVEDEELLAIQHGSAAKEILPGSDNAEEPNLSAMFSKDHKLSPIEAELAKLIPVRKYWSFSSLSQKRHLLPKEEWVHAWEVEQATGTYTTLALFWADGKRTLLEVAEHVALETGKWEPELILNFFRLLHDVGAIDFS